MSTTRYEKAKGKLGDDFREAREKKRLTQAEVAVKAGIHVNYYARLERGKENPSFEVLQSIMAVLDIKCIKRY